MSTHGLCIKARTTAYNVYKWALYQGEYHSLQCLSMGSVSRWVPQLTMSTNGPCIKASTIAYNVYIWTLYQGEYHSLQCLQMGPVSRRVSQLTMSTNGPCIKASITAYNVYKWALYQGEYHSLQCLQMGPVSRQVPQLRLASPIHQQHAHQSFLTSSQAGMLPCFWLNLNSDSIVHKFSLNFCPRLTWNFLRI